MFERRGLFLFPFQADERDGTLQVIRKKEGFSESPPTYR